MLIKSMLFKKMGLVLLALSFTGCAALHSVSMTSYPKDRRKPVQAEVKKFVFLGFNFNNDFVLDLTPRLQQQCPGGKITGITSTYETRWYVFAHDMIVRSQGFCVKN